MYKEPEVIQKKLKYLIKHMKYIGVISTMAFLFCILIIIVGKGEVNNIIPIIIFMFIWYLMFYAIYIYLAYKIPLSIDVNSNGVNIRTSAKEIMVESINSIEMIEGVNNFILKVAYNGRYLKLYVPKYLNESYNLDKQIDYMFNRGKRTKVYYDFFVRFF